MPEIVPVGFTWADAGGAMISTRRKAAKQLAIKFLFVQEGSISIIPFSFKLSASAPLPADALSLRAVP